MTSRRASPGTPGQAVPQAVQEQRVDRCRFSRPALRARLVRCACPLPVALRLPNKLTWVSSPWPACRPAACGLLVEIVGDAHRTDRVRAGRARADLVELVAVVSTGPLAFITTFRSAASGTEGAQRPPRVARRLPAAGPFVRSRRVQPSSPPRPNHGAAHDELSAVDADRRSRRQLRRRGPRPDPLIVVFHVVSVWPCRNAPLR